MLDTLVAVGGGYLAARAVEISCTVAVLKYRAKKHAVATEAERLKYDDMYWSYMASQEAQKQEAE